ncbi:MAG TPA: stalk domain-containing protein [Syntrophomonadaceae bacterium]|nr:stalk domain-containing protein [Syntrophomonadaceae bacterium]
MKISLRCLSILVMTVLMSILAFGSCFAADNGLVAQYKLNGDCNDASGNGNNGTAVGDVSFVDDQVMGKCAVFNGGYINVPSSPGLNLGNNFTLSVWVMVDPVMAANGNKTGSIISKLDDASNYNNYHLYTRGTFGVRADARTTNGEASIQNGAFQDWGLGADWSNLVLSYDGQTLYLYDNGALKATKELKSGTSIKASGNKMRIGTGNDLNNSELFYRGKMADLRIYSNALSSDQIKALYNGGADTKTTSQQPAASGTATTGGTATPGTTPTTGSNGGSGGPVTIINNNTTNITNSTNTTNNANTNTNITGSTISNSNIASNNQVNQTTSVSNATTVTQYVNVLVNGQSLQSDVKPFINADGRTMLPVRAIAEALGAQVQWDEATQTATLTLGAKTVKIPIGQNSILVDGQPTSMDTIAAIKDGRTLLPVRSVGEALGAQIGWDESTQTVSINK